MRSGADYLHKQLRTELEDYIKAQYFRKSPVLLSAVSGRLDNEGLLYRKPFIESSPAYVSVPDGLRKSELQEWMKDYFVKLSEAGIGVFSSPFAHQLSALTAANKGRDLFVATGTGSGKTECFMWPILAKLANEAKNSPDTWSKRGCRVIIMYPMNALVSDQLSRLRRMTGDPENRFINIFRDTCGANVRRPQFGMYTGRTPYPGREPSESQDKKLAQTLKRISFPQNDQEKDYFSLLLKEGKIPAKADMNGFTEELKKGRHTTDPEDAELITRFEMQQFCPDILITNYSMLEYMLMRPREQKIWDDTREWLAADSNNKLLFVIDEAHMYRGSAGGEVSFLIRRLFRKLNIGRDRVQFILTTASMPDDNKAVMRFAHDLTAADSKADFCYLTGEREKIDDRVKYDIAAEVFLNAEISDLEGSDEVKFAALKKFWSGVEGFAQNADSLESLYDLMYDSLLYYRPFNVLLCRCRGNAVALDELSAEIFPDLEKEDALKAVSVMLAVAPLAKSRKGAVLFPARMHMLFRGISGVYACTNEKCTHAHSADGISLGEVFLKDGNLVCPHCGSVVYELYTDRHCGALFFKGYIHEDMFSECLCGSTKNTYFWHYPGQIFDKGLREIHLFIPSQTDEKILSKHKGKKAPKPCYLDVRNGFINFTDDSDDGKEGIRKLYYYYNPEDKEAENPRLISFTSCPHCHTKLTGLPPSSFSTRGNQSFYNLISAQFRHQPAVAEKAADPARFPNAGRKVLLFSDSRRVAARLARDMSEISDTAAVRQLFAIALNNMHDETADKVYGYLCLAAALHRVQLFSGPERSRFIEDCRNVLKRYELCRKLKKEFKPNSSMPADHIPIQTAFLRMFAGGYNTLYDSASCFFLPADENMMYALEELYSVNENITEQEFIEVFNAWIMWACDKFLALGSEISDEARKNVTKRYQGYGLEDGWSFPKVILDIMGIKKGDKEESTWQEALSSHFLQVKNNGRKYIPIEAVEPCTDMEHTWFRCSVCSAVTPFKLKGKCPVCGSEHISEMTKEDYDALSFWRNPFYDALKLKEGEPIVVINTEEHTAQLSHKDQRDDLWSKTEQYELRFRDLISDNEKPVDILSSTTTMEVGIDIGSLVAVGLRNIPPMRENYQQRAGRAGRRGAGLSSVVTFCEGGPHDSLYFSDPVPMLRGEPRKPWVDTRSEKLLQRHATMVVLQEYLALHAMSLDETAAADFLCNRLTDFKTFLSSYPDERIFSTLPAESNFNSDSFKQQLIQSLEQLKAKCEAHPELFSSVSVGENSTEKVLLDALYYEGIIPTYSFPKNVVSTYIQNQYGAVEYEAERGLDIAIGEYAPGRELVIDKRTYQIGGFYYPGSDRAKGMALRPALTYTEDPNYVKDIQSCPVCGWFGLSEDHNKICPFCGNKNLGHSRQMLRPWGFAPMGAEDIQEAQLKEEYTAVQLPLYSTLPDAKDMLSLAGYKNIRIASRSNQRIIMINTGKNNEGFIVCKECGAALPGHNSDRLKNVGRPYKNKFAVSKCRHTNCINVNLGYDFITDMLVLEFRLDRSIINDDRERNPWLNRSAQSLAEALRLVACKKLDVEFTEMVTGYRLRNARDASYIDIYLYDSLSSGAGYAVSVSEAIEELLEEVRIMLSSCSCDSACSNCLKHYRNQFVHGSLDRFAALQLLDWGTEGIAAPPLAKDTQRRLLKPLTDILEDAGCQLCEKQDDLYIQKGCKSKKIVAYPGMLKEPYEAGTIFVSDAYLKYAKPSALLRIQDDLI